MPDKSVDLLTALLAAIVTMWTTYIAAKRRGDGPGVAEDDGMESDPDKLGGQAKE